MRDGYSGMVSVFFVGCMAGVVIGGALGLLLAPQKGEVSRQQIRRKIKLVKPITKQGGEGDWIELESNVDTSGADSAEKN